MIGYIALFLTAYTAIFLGTYSSGIFNWKDYTKESFTVILIEMCSAWVFLLWHCILFTIGIFIALITYIPNKIFGGRDKVFAFLDRYFPIPCY